MERSRTIQIEDTFVGAKLQEIQEQIKHGFEGQGTYSDTAMAVLIEKIDSLTQEVEKLKSEKSISVCSINDVEARERFIQILREMKIKGKSQVNIIELQSALDLPAEQFFRIFDALKRESKLIPEPDE